MSASHSKRRRIDDRSNPIPEPILTSATLYLNTFNATLTSSATGSHVDSIRLTTGEPRCTIGRSRRLCQFVFEEEHRVVSKQHCQILLNLIDGRVSIVDGYGNARASFNGVFVNGIRVAAGEAVVLRERDVVGLGCRNRDVCGRGNGIRFAVQKIVLERAIRSGDFSTEAGEGNGLGLERVDYVMSRVNDLLSCCKKVLKSTDPVSTIAQLPISKGGLSNRSKLLQEDTGQNNAATEVLVGCVGNKQYSQYTGKAQALQEKIVDNSFFPSNVNAGEDNPSDKLMGQSFDSRIIDHHPVDYLKREDDGGTLCPPPGKRFYLNNITSANFVTSGDHVSVSLPELLHPVESLTGIFIATFTSDIPWFLGSCGIPVHLPVTIACHNAERCWNANPDSRFTVPFSDFPRLVVVYPSFPEAIAFGSDRSKRGVACHHPKFFLLLREHSVRVIITSANLNEKQWNSVTNTIWWQDFPRAFVPNYLALFSYLPEHDEVRHSDFAAQLARLVAILVTDVPSLAYWVVDLAKYDFEGASGYLVISIPGIHSLVPPYLSDSKAAHKPLYPRLGYVGSVDTFVVGLSHLFCTKADTNGLQLKKLASFFANCRSTTFGSVEVVLRRNKKIAADANAVSVFVTDQNNASENEWVQLGFLPRDSARWVSPLWDGEFFIFVGYICPREAIEVALGKTSGKKVRLSLHVAQGPQFSNLSRMMKVEHEVAFCSLIASVQRCLGIWRLQEVVGRYSWPEPLETDFVYGSSSIGSSVSPQFLATFSSAIGKRALDFPYSEESDPEWGRWSTSQESKNPSMKIVFPSIERVKNLTCGIMPFKRILCLRERTWQRLRPAGNFHDAVPHPEQRVGYPMHVKVAMRRFQSKMDSSSFGWVYCGSHNFSAAAWGRVFNTTETNVSETYSPRYSLSGSRLRICNYEVGIVFLFPPPGAGKLRASSSKKDNTSIDNIKLPFVMPPPKYKPSDRPATFQALREAMHIEFAKHKHQSLPQGEVLEDEEEMIEEEPNNINEVIEVVEETEDDKAYAEELFSQVRSSQG